MHPAINNLLYICYNLLKICKLLCTNFFSKIVHVFFQFFAMILCQERQKNRNRCFFSKKRGELLATGENSSIKHRVS